MSKILIAEDDPMTGQVYTNALRTAGFEVTLAPDGESFVALVSELQPDALLVDVMLPKLGGIAAIKRLREGGNQIPIIAVTNAFVPKLVADARGAGASEVLNKRDVTPGQLRVIFEKLLSAQTHPVQSSSGSDCEVSEAGWACRKSAI